MNLTLIGFKNSGKSSVGKLLATTMEKTFFDTDTMCEQKYFQNTGNKLTGCEIYRKHGESFFRNLESEVISSMSGKDNCIIATGGGSVLNKVNIINLKINSKLIYLKLSFESLLARIKQNPLPAFIDATQPEESFRIVFEERKYIYLDSADVVVETDNKTIVEIASIINSMIIAY
jgi:shikimate kinase